MKRRPGALVLLVVLGACADDQATEATPSVAPTASHSETPPPPARPDLTDELIAKLPDEVRWADEDTEVTYEDGSTALLGRSDDEALVMSVNTPDGRAFFGRPPDHAAEGGLAPDLMHLESGGVGYVVYQGGGEFAAINLMVAVGDDLVSAGQACFDLETNAYAAC